MQFIPLVIIVHILSVGLEKISFQQSSFQSLVSHDPSEIILICWFAAQETSSIIRVKKKTGDVLDIFVMTMTFFLDSLMNKV